MLVLTRKIEQEIYIGKEKIVVKVLSITKDKVRLGISAEKTTPIWREDKKKSKQSAYQLVKKITLAENEHHES